LSRVLLEKLIVTQLVKKFPPFMEPESPPLALVLSHMHPVHTFSPHFRKVQFNIILPSTRRYSEWSLSFRFSDQNSV